MLWVAVGVLWVDVDEVVVVDVNCTEQPVVEEVSIDTISDQIPFTSSLVDQNETPPLQEKSPF